MLKGISFQVLKAEHENPFFTHSRLYLGIWIFLQNQLSASRGINYKCLKLSLNANGTTLPDNVWNVFQYFLCFTTS